MREVVAALVADKDQVRRRAWAALKAEGVARFPGAWGRIPNFAGASAADRIRELSAWKSARVIKSNPDSPQLPRRRAALRDTASGAPLARPGLTPLRLAGDSQG